MIWNVPIFKYIIQHYFRGSYTANNCVPGENKKNLNKIKKNLINNINSCCSSENIYILIYSINYLFRRKNVVCSVSVQALRFPPTKQHFVVHASRSLYLLEILIMLYSETEAYSEIKRGNNNGSVKTDIRI